MILRGECHDLDIALFEEELCSVAQGLLDGNPQEGAIVLECTGLSNLAPAVAAKIRPAHF